METIEECSARLGWKRPHSLCGRTGLESSRTTWRGPRTPICAAEVHPKCTHELSSRKKSNHCVGLGFSEIRDAWVSGEESGANRFGVSMDDFWFFGATFVDGSSRLSRKPSSLPCTRQILPLSLSYGRFQLREALWLVIPNSLPPAKPPTVSRYLAMVTRYRPDWSSG